MIGIKLKQKLDEIGEDAMKTAEKYHCNKCDRNWNDIPYKDGQSLICPHCDTVTNSKSIGKATDKFRIYPKQQKKENNDIRDVICHYCGKLFLEEKDGSSECLIDEDNHKGYVCNDCMSKW